MLVGHTSLRQTTLQLIQTPLHPHQFFLAASLFVSAFMAHDEVGTESDSCQPKKTTETPTEKQRHLHLCLLGFKSSDDSQLIAHLGLSMPQ
jgi:hypothetical protein